MKKLCVTMFLSLLPLISAAMERTGQEAVSLKLIDEPLILAIRANDAKRVKDLLVVTKNYNAFYDIYLSEARAKRAELAQDLPANVSVDVLLQFAVQNPSLWRTLKDSGEIISLLQNKRGMP